MAPQSWSGANAASLPGGTILAATHYFRDHCNTHCFGVCAHFPAKYPFVCFCSIVCQCLEKSVPESLQVCGGFYNVHSCG
eukprot:3066522-Amphidinium_carterae.2